jgi:DnaJ domain
MPCACERCIRHSRTLGLPARPPSKASIRKAYKASAKLWHPDRYENNPAKRLQAEEQFKLIQVAYRELSDHCEKPEKEPSVPTRSAGPATQPATPPIFFGDAPGCFVFPHLPPSVVNIFAVYLQDTECAAAFIDLSMTGIRREIGAQYILLTNRRIIVRDAMGVVSLLWYSDLGEIRLLDRDEFRKPSIWERIVEKTWGIKHRHVLEINRLNGAHFFSILGQAHDNVKRVIYNFLLQMKKQERP